MKKLSEEKMEKLQGGSGFACAAMVGWGIVGIGLAATAATGIGMLGALAAGAAMLDSAHNCVSKDQHPTRWLEADQVASTAAITNN